MWFHTLAFSVVLAYSSAGPINASTDNPLVTKNTYVIILASDPANPQRAEYNSSFGFHNFNDITVCFGLWPSKNNVTIFSYSTTNETNYLYLTLDLDSQIGTFKYSTDIVTVNLPVIPLKVWTHICLIRAIEARGKVNGDEVNGTFTLGQKRDENDPTKWDVAEGMEGKLTNFQMWGKSGEEGLNNKNIVSAFLHYPCYQIPGNVIDWSAESWTYIGTTRQETTMNCTTEPSVITAHKTGIKTSTASLIMRQGIEQSAINSIKVLSGLINDIGNILN